jgi:hypothetical protein
MAKLLVRSLQQGSQWAMIITGGSPPFDTVFRFPVRSHKNIHNIRNKSKLRKAHGVSVSAWYYILLVLPVLAIMVSLQFDHIFGGNHNIG